MRAICPGSFDPVTFGHLDIIGRTAAMFDEVVVAVGHNMSKSGLFLPEERVEMIEQCTSDLPGVSATLFSGLLVDFCAEQGIGAIAKGLRFGADFDYELQMAQMNGHLTGVETIFLPTAPQWSFVSSSLVREVAQLGGDVSALVPPLVVDRVRSRLAERAGEKGENQ
ncbi:MAG: pantetheine-phosphate adenylyltransferase [Propionibacteriaceae bacterium]|nr:pantetheine-phosphate adenylyltransferase [Propionibacteriaceae bacterium]